MPDNLIPELGSGGFWATLITTLGVGGTAAYKAFRKVKDDNTDDERNKLTDSAMAGVIGHLRSEVERLTGEVTKMSGTIDAMAKERNEALAVAAKAQAEALVLSGKLATLEEDVKELRKELADAEEQLKAKDTGERRRHADYHPKAPQDQDRREM